MSRCVRAIVLPVALVIAVLLGVLACGDANPSSPAPAADKSGATAADKPATPTTTPSTPTTTAPTTAPTAVPASPASSGNLAADFAEAFTLIELDGQTPKAAQQLKVVPVGDESATIERIQSLHAKLTSLDKAESQRLSEELRRIWGVHQLPPVAYWDEQQRKQFHPTGDQRRAAMHTGLLITASAGQSRVTRWYLETFKDQPLMMDALYIAAELTLRIGRERGE